MSPFLVTRETWNDVASKGQLSLLPLSIVSNAITNVLQMSYILSEALLLGNFSGFGFS